VGQPQGQQQQEQQQQQASSCDNSWLEDQAAAATGAVIREDDLAAAAACRTADLQDDEQMLQSYTLPAEPATAATADINSSSSSSTSAGVVLFDFTFNPHSLQPLNPADLVPPSGGLNPTDPSLKPNRLVLQLGDGLYTLPPPSPQPLDTSESEGLGFGEDQEYEWVAGDMPSSSVQLFPGYKSSLKPQGLPGFRRQLSAGHRQPPSVTKQQQLFR
jgi:hypothetical protein